MGIIQDVLSIFNRSHIKLKEKRHEVGDVYTFVFEKDNQTNWKVGQHGIFTINHEKIKKPTRAFSIASSSTENCIMISTRIGTNPSPFKEALLSLQPGMSVTMRGPVGALYSPAKRPQLLIAGGLGITPYRAIIKELMMDTKGHAKNIQLIYLESRGEFIYQPEWDRLKNESDFQISYVKAREDMISKVGEFVDQHHNGAVYYIVGSKSLIKSTKEFLLDKDIQKNNIRRDTFIGY